MGSQNISTLSAKDLVTHAPSSRTVALYRGLKVTVYTVDKPEINLTRQDLVELVNVRSSSFILCRPIFTFITALDFNKRI